MGKQVGKKKKTSSAKKKKQASSAIVQAYSLLKGYVSDPNIEKPAKELKTLQHILTALESVKKKQENRAMQGVRKPKSKPAPVTAESESKPLFPPKMPEN